MNSSIPKDISVEQTWKIVNEIVNKTFKTTKIESIKIENEVISDNSKIPNLMNSYFCSIGETTKANVPHQTEFSHSR